MLVFVRVFLFVWQFSGFSQACETAATDVAGSPPSFFVFLREEKKGGGRSGGGGERRGRESTSAAAIHTPVSPSCHVAVASR